jgi:hypothetical protein
MRLPDGLTTVEGSALASWFPSGVIRPEADREKGQNSGQRSCEEPFDRRIGYNPRE